MVVVAEQSNFLFWMNVAPLYLRADLDLCTTSTLLSTINGKQE